MRAHLFKNNASSARCKKRHHVASAHNHVERLTDPARWKVELGKIADEPSRPGMILPRRCDQFRIAIDADNVMSKVKQDRTHAAGTAASIQDARATPNHCIDAPRLAAEIEPLCGKITKFLDVSLRVLRILFDNSRPLAAFSHEENRRRPPRSAP